MKQKKAKSVALLSAITMLLTATACGKLPPKYPGIEEDDKKIEMGDRFQVNFFFQNNENSYYISPNGDAYQFFNALAQTFSSMSYSEVSKTYVMDYADEAQKYNIVEYDRNAHDNLIWEDAREEYACGGKKAKGKDNFYILDSEHDISMDSRVDGGMLHLFLNEVEKVSDITPSDSKEQVDSSVAEEQKKDENKREDNKKEEKTKGDNNKATDSKEKKNDSFFEPDAINVLFTDLSEKDITYLGEKLRQCYTQDNRYSACVMAMKLEMSEGSKEEPHCIYYAGKDNANGLTKKDVGDSRWFYLLMMGPTTDLATFAQNLTQHLNQIGIQEGNADDGGYEISDLNFTSTDFDAQKDLKIQTLDQMSEKDKKDTSDKAVNRCFENYMVRLNPVEDADSVFSVGIYRDSILEYKYTSAEKQLGLDGYNNAKTKDFAINITLDKKIEQFDLVAKDTKLDYVFGNPVIYYEKDSKWTEMDPDHQERFFHEVSTEGNDGKQLTLIGDNSDECGIHNIYVTVPILQKATVSNIISTDPTSTTDWVLKECTFNSSDPNEEVKRTYYFDKFYMNLFDMEIENSRDENGNRFNDEKDIYSQIDELKILIEDLH
ncbi:hypothetical protein [Ruminococcus sp.]|uniref:hypothetical protein n=1 Tax=Ruminococcus sp. TaxID=41978 RepID=UPI0025DF58AF|nr:hypothetical protein [Ruminococcus sp.]